MTKQNDRTPTQKAQSMTSNIAYAYQQAPWRRQLQWLGFFLLSLILVVLAAGMYLHITARTAEVGVGVQSLENQKEELQLSIADLRLQVGELTSAEVMERRALEMGFLPANLNEAVYLVVPGYTGRQPALLAAPPAAEVAKPVLVPAYTQSLWEWLFQGKLQFAEPLGGLLP